MAPRKRKSRIPMSDSKYKNKRPIKKLKAIKLRLKTEKALAKLKSETDE